MLLNSASRGTSPRVQLHGYAERTSGARTLRSREHWGISPRSSAGALRSKKPRPYPRTPPHQRAALRRPVAHSVAQIHHLIQKECRPRMLLWQLYKKTKTCIRPSPGNEGLQRGKKTGTCRQDIKYQPRWDHCEFMGGALRACAEGTKAITDASATLTPTAREDPRLLAVRPRRKLARLSSLAAALSAGTNSRFPGQP